MLRSLVYIYYSIINGMHPLQWVQFIKLIKLHTICINLEINLIKREKDGNWSAKCDLCQWKTVESKRNNAQNKLSNHINIIHKKGIEVTKKQKSTIPPAEKPPKLPSPIKEN